MKQLAKAKLFVAIEVPSQFHQPLLHIQKAIQSSSTCRGTYPSTTLMHVTLQFLGIFDPSHIKAIITALQSIHASAFTVAFDAIDLFTKHGHPAIIYVKSTSPELASLARKISKAALSFTPANNQPFIGHLTLMRIKETVNEQGLYALLTSLTVPSLSWKVDSFIVMESLLKQGRHIYQERARFQLS
ncbi:MAG TPA: RNA 2',3'-cyclic phosphodiesterase [Candidatus Babeliales bacterium]|jgi:2'-5' RNA ligase|nr:RNA 2',3'-cyclic phosphodiesterase [Candidatus Babeliales bacterium]